MEARYVRCSLQQGRTGLRHRPRATTEEKEIEMYDEIFELTADAICGDCCLLGGGGNKDAEDKA